MYDDVFFFSCFVYFNVACATAMRAEFIIEISTGEQPSLSLMNGAHVETSC